MGLSILNVFEWCPTSHSFCFCVSLRRGVMCSACIGLVWGAVHFAVYLYLGAYLLYSLGLWENYDASRAVMLFNYALGVLLCAGHGLLLGAVIEGNSALCMLYAGLATTLAFILLLLAPAVSLAAAASGLITLDVAFLVPLVAAVAALMLLYFVVIVVNYVSTLPPKG